MPSATQYTIGDGAYALDGGSIYLLLREPDGVEHSLVLTQHRIPMHETDSRIPGRLYLDDRIIEVRSQEEADLISAIKRAGISPASTERRSSAEESESTVVIGEDISDFLAATRASPKAAIRHLVDTLVAFVESEEYVDLSEK